jgi:hypothetical protein
LGFLDHAFLHAEMPGFGIACLESHQRH